MGGLGRHWSIQGNTPNGTYISVSCRQLGVQLHELQPALPLFDGVTGQAVAQAVDTRVERLRDALMDDARERVDDLGEDLVVGAKLPLLLSAGRVNMPKFRFANVCHRLI